ncbi:MAG TPA: hypothetical protein VGP63_08110 [Planctomycetaceae bacterium]|jgi:hypothetical protein|nr:hypothetical protein [Planctomycetaceae bacterium]
MKNVETTKPKGDVRSAAAAYGSALGVVICLLMFALPFPIGLVILCVGLCVQMTCLAVVVWRRTRLPLMSAAGLIVAVGCGVQIYVAIHALVAGNGRPPGFADLIYLWPMAAAAAVGPLCFFAEWLWHRDRWEALKAAMEDCTVTDMLLFRHIPNLRERPTAAEHSGEGAT